MAKIQILLALVAGMLLLNLNGCNPTGGNLPADDDTSTTDDDDTVVDDDDNDDTGTVILSVDETMPTVQVVVSSLGSEERTMTSCTTICTLTGIHAGRYLATAELENALFVSVELEVVADQITAHTFAGGWIHNGVYARFLDEAGTEPNGSDTYSVHTEVNGGMVKIRIDPGDWFEVEGDTFTSIGTPKVYSVTLEPNHKFEFHNISGEVRYFIRQ